MLAIVIPETLLDEILFLIFLPIILSPASTRWSLFYNLYPFIFLSEFIIGFSSIGGPNRNPPNCTILDNRVFEKLVLADNHFQMLYEFLKFVY